MNRDKEKIALGECVSPYTTDHCPYCIDTCDASANRRRLNDLLEDTKVSKPLKEDKP